ncbi:MAG: hypothetical protein GC155_18865 [Alphaproteobacteria bacterium]|nr:hypothetical protein [Alphaproteobacteria bacterium]
MRYVPAIFLAAALTASCHGQSPPLAADKAAPGACDARTQKAWPAQKDKGIGDGVTIEARTFGAACAKAVVLLDIRDAAGIPLYTWSARTLDVFGLMDAADPPAMKTALAEWIDQGLSAYPDSGQLPDWPEGAATPIAGEFPFYPAEGVDREGYLAIRSQGLPMLCFPQGHESSDCMFMRNGVGESLGLQTFPG